MEIGIPDLIAAADESRILRQMLARDPVDVELHRIALQNARAAGFKSFVPAGKRRLIGLCLALCRSKSLAV